MPSSFGFPKSARLIHPTEFSFRPYHIVNGEHLRFIFTPRGQGRLGLSISKKFLKHSVARNRVRRLAREVFRKNQFRYEFMDINILGAPGLKEKWRDLSESDILTEFERLDHALVKLQETGRI